MRGHVAFSRPFPGFPARFFHHFVCSCVSHNSCTVAPIEPIPGALEGPRKAATRGDGEAAKTARRGVLSPLLPAYLARTFSRPFLVQLRLAKHFMSFSRSHNSCMRAPIEPLFVALGSFQEVEISYTCSFPDTGVVPRR